MKTITELILGSGANIKVIDLLMEGRELDYAVSDIVEGTRLSKQHVHRVLKRLQDYKLVKKTRTVGAIQLYSWDMTNDLGKAFIILQNAMLNYNLKLMEKKYGRTRKKNPH